MEHIPLAAQPLGLNWLHERTVALVSLHAKPEGGLGAAVEAGGCGRPGVAAVASFNGRTAGDGWGRLNVTTCPGLDAHEQMFGAGYVEGFVTGLQMELYWTNYAAAEYPPAGAPPAALRSWMASQLAWAREQVDEHAESEPRWAAMGLILAHYDGLVAG